VNLWSIGSMDLAVAVGVAIALAVGALRAADGHIGIGSRLISFPRYFDPQQGRLIIGGVDARDMPLAYVPRHPRAVLD
jgi:hypothetical protein